MRGYLPVMPDPSDPRPNGSLPRQLHKPARGTRNAMPADHRPEVADYRPSAYGKNQQPRRKSSR
jgi:hypothetical protein